MEEERDVKSWKRERATSNNEGEELGCRAKLKNLALVEPEENGAPGGGGRRKGM